MNRSAFSALVAAAAVGGSLHIATGQMVNPAVQTTSAQVAPSRSAPTTAAKPVAGARVPPQIVSRPTGMNPQRFGTFPQPPANLQRGYSPTVQTSNPAFAALSVQRNAPMEQPISLAAIRQRRGIVTRDGNILDPATRGNDVRTLQTMHQQPGLATERAHTLDPTTRETESRTLQKMREHRGFGTDNRTLATIDPQQHVTNRNPEAGPQAEKPEGPKGHHEKKWHNKKGRIGFDEAFRSHWHEWHDRNWWHDHCNTIVFVTTGYYFLDGSYWYPAYGYDPLQAYYDYDGPIYTYSNLLPDEVIANVQTALQDAGYYYGSITGSLSVDTRAAIANFQRDYGLQMTGAIDQDTVEALGLY
jgi:hypothetical protein